MTPLKTPFLSECCVIKLAGMSYAFVFANGRKDGNPQTKCPKEAESDEDVHGKYGGARTFGGNHNGWFRIRGPDAGGTGNDSSEGSGSGKCAGVAGTPGSGNGKSPGSQCKGTKIGERGEEGFSHRGDRRNGFPDRNRHVLGEGFCIQPGREPGSCRA